MQGGGGRVEWGRLLGPRARARPKSQEQQPENEDAGVHLQSETRNAAFNFPKVRQPRA
ncbi:hypothetical protein GCM10011378_13720 [Hymenobacter glacieicola]|uniref:Uncharacterized protein n=1 Tax=Hymenobacter glacieicola TaxID=1562124 RepID=A0ABQ1WNG3_9BACT|nr:hypothetical protein GCM10011378_13720 [Hymenobacter glacieicola]